MSSRTSFVGSFLQPTLVASHRNWNGQMTLNFRSWLTVIVRVLVFSISARFPQGSFGAFREYGALIGDRFPWLPFVHAA